LTTNQVEFAKNFWKKLGTPKEGTYNKFEKDGAAAKGSQGEGGDVDQVLKAEQPGQEKGVHRHKNVMSGSWQFLDNLIHNLFPIGDPHGGLPDGVLAMGKYCVEFVVKGILALIFSTIRWPHKIFFKTIVILSALTLIATNAVYCLNPISIANYIQKAKVVNRVNDDLDKLNKQFKIRLANIIDRVHMFQEIVKQGCCAYVDFKRKVIETVPDEAKEFMASMFASLLKMHQVVYCGDYQDGSPECEGVEFVDDEPMRMLPRTWCTLFAEAFMKFF